MKQFIKFKDSITKYFTKIGGYYKEDLSQYGECWEY